MAAKLTRPRARDVQQFGACEISVVRVNSAGNQYRTVVEARRGVQSPTFVKLGRWGPRSTGGIEMHRAISDPGEHETGRYPTHASILSICHIVTSRPGSSKYSDLSRSKFWRVQYPFEAIAKNPKAIP